MNEHSTSLQRWVLGDLYTFKVLGDSTNQSFALLELQIRPGGGAPLHCHSQEDESFYILEGALEFCLGDRRMLATPGTFLHAPKGIPHSFTNRSDRPMKMLTWVNPAGLEQFFLEIGHPIDDPQTPPAVTIAELEALPNVAQKYGLTIFPPA